MIATCAWWATALRVIGPRSSRPYCRGSGARAQRSSRSGLTAWWTSAPYGSSTSGREGYGHLHLGGSAGPPTASEGDYATLLRDRRRTPGATRGHRGAT